MPKNTQAGQLDAGQFLSEIRAKDPHLAITLQQIIDGVNRLATNTATSPIGDVSPPKSPDSVTVKVSGEMAHISISHSGELQRGVRYFSEVSTNQAFGQPIVIDHGSSRTATPITLPTYQDDGTTLNTYYVRSYAQYPGSPPSPPTVCNNNGFQMQGSTKMTPLPSNGSGTAPNNGQSAGQGLGKFQQRGK